MKKRRKNYLHSALVITLIFFTANVFAQEKESGEWKAPAEANQLVNPLKENPDAVKAGKKLYKQQCAICHGVTGKGDGVAGMTLTPRPASFHSERVRNETDGALFWKITYGNPPMAAYKDVLTEEQRWQLVNYIRSLSK